jgi:hypothetical protein
MFRAVMIAARGFTRTFCPRLRRAAFSIESGTAWHRREISNGKQKQGPRGQELHVNSLAAGRGPRN